MKKYFLLLMAVCMTAFTAVSFTSCSKDDEVTASTDNVKSELQGTWKGSYASMYIDGHPAEYIDIVFAFSGDKLTVTTGETSNTYSYTIVESAGQKYLSFDGHAIFFELSGNKFKITNTNGSYLLFAVGAELIKQ